MCGKFYVGQIGSCADGRLRDHGQNLTNDAIHFLTHCGTCRCEPRFCGTTILGSTTTQKLWELMEAYFIRKKGPVCVSVTSIALNNAEMFFEKYDKISSSHMHGHVLLILQSFLLVLYPLNTVVNITCICIRPRWEL